MATKQTPQGFLGNLTADQEIRLRQMWAIVLRLLDAQALGAAEPSPDPGVNRRNSTLTRTSTTISATAGSAYTEALGKALQDVGVSSTEIRAVRDALTNLTTDDMRFGLLSTAKCDHPDSLLLRFLRARKWDVGKSFCMMLHAMVWRIKIQHVDDRVVANGELHALRQEKDTSKPEQAKAGSQFLAQMRMGKCFIHGVDRENRPIGVVRARLHRPSEQSEEVITRYILHIIEMARLLLLPPIENVTIVFDMTGFSLSNMEYAPVKFLIDCFQANYPESLGMIIIYNAPWIFSGIWRIIKGWMDPVIVAKVQFASTFADVEKFIAPENIAPEIGTKGTSYKYVEPSETENDPMNDTATRDSLMESRTAIGEELLLVTGQWISAHQSNDQAKITELAPRRNDVIERLRVNYWSLDPHIRAKNHLDRTDIIQPGGRIAFYPGSETSSDGETAKAMEVEHVEQAQVKVVDV